MLSESKSGTFRISGYGGAGFYLRSQVIPIDSEVQDNSTLAFDVGFLGPTGFNNYFQRRAGDSFVWKLSVFLYAAANELHPEQSLPAFEDEVMGLSISIVSSTDFRVGMNISLVEDLDSDVKEFDDLDFETSRASMVSASDQSRFLTLLDEGPGRESGDHE